MTLITRMIALLDVEGDVPDVFHVPPKSVFGRFAVLAEESDGRIDSLNGGLGGRSIDLKQKGWADAEGIDHEEEEKEPEEPGQVASTTVVGLGLRSFWLLVHGESVASAGDGSKAMQVTTNRD